MYGRELDRAETTFGTSGYTFDQTFVLYDRSTKSLWYPKGKSAMKAVAGKKKGATIPLLDRPKVMSLAKWIEKHPDTLVLIGDDRPNVTMIRRDPNEIP